MADMDNEEDKVGRERRRHIRTELKVWVRLEHSSLEQTLELVSENVSHGGAFILAGGHDLPGEGELVRMQVKGMAETAPIVTAKVIRKIAKGIAVNFIESDSSTPSSE